MVPSKQRVRLLFWNIHGVNLDTNDARFSRMQRLLGKVVASRKVDILILAESCYAGSLNLPGMREAKNALPANQRTGGRLEIYHKGTVEITGQIGGVHRSTIHSVRANQSGQTFLLTALHLDSALFRSDESRGERARNIVAEIIRVEISERNERALVIGDFNFNPYDPFMIHAFGFNSVAARNIAGRVSVLLMG